MVELYADAVAVNERRRVDDAQGLVHPRIDRVAEACGRTLEAQPVFRPDGALDRARGFDLRHRIGRGHEWREILQRGAIACCGLGGAAGLELHARHAALDQESEPPPRDVIGMRAVEPRGFDCAAVRRRAFLRPEEHFLPFRLERLGAGTLLVEMRKRRFEPLAVVEPARHRHRVEEALGRAVRHLRGGPQARGREEEAAQRPGGKAVEPGPGQRQTRNGARPPSGGGPRACAPLRRPVGSYARIGGARSEIGPRCHAVLPSRAGMLSYPRLDGHAL